MEKNATESLMRTALLDFLRSREDGDCVFMNELSVAGFERRADLVLANGHLSVYEIKSAADTLVRLGGQLACYQKYFEATTVVCAPKHLKGVLRLASRSTGVMTVDRDGILQSVQPASFKGITKHSWLSYLPVTELRKLLRLHDVRIPPADHRSSLLRSCQRLRLADIRGHALAYLKLRNERNAKLRTELARKQLEREVYRGAPQPSLPDWLEIFSGVGPLKAIPRKCS